MWWKKNHPLLPLTPSDVISYTFADTSGETQHLKMLTGEYEGIVFAYNNVRIHEESQQARFEFTFEEQGTVKRGSGIACKDANKNWRMLGSEML